MLSDNVCGFLGPSRWKWSFKNSIQDLSLISQTNKTNVLDSPEHLQPTTGLFAQFLEMKMTCDSLYSSGTPSFSVSPSWSMVSVEQSFPLYYTETVLYEVARYQTSALFSELQVKTLQVQQCVPVRNGLPSSEMRVLRSLSRRGKSTMPPLTASKINHTIQLTTLRGKVFGADSDIHM